MEAGCKVRLTVWSSATGLEDGTHDALGLRWSVPLQPLQRQGHDNDDKQYRIDPFIYDFSQRGSEGSLMIEALKEY
jgi:hypothetical protein